MKYYFADAGLRNARLNFRQFEESHIMENIVYSELRMRGWSVDVGCVVLNGRENGCNMRKQVEIDFVANLGSRRLYVQSALALPDEEKIRQEVRPLAAVRDSFEKIILVRAPIRPWRNDLGIVTMSVFDFLLQEDPAIP